MFNCTFTPIEVMTKTGCGYRKNIHNKNRLKSSMEGKELIKKWTGHISLSRIRGGKFLFN